jgi:hypothetical protein
MELSRARMYAERAKRSRSILLYSAGTVRTSDRSSSLTTFCIAPFLLMAQPR